MPTHLSLSRSCIFFLEDRLWGPKAKQDSGAHKRPLVAVRENRLQADQTAGRPRTTRVEETALVREGWWEQIVEPSHSRDRKEGGSR